MGKVRSGMAVGGLAIAAAALVGFDVVGVDSNDPEGVEAESAAFGAVHVEAIGRTQSGLVQEGPRRVMPSELNVPTSLTGSGHVYEVRISTHAPGGSPEPFRTGRIDVRPTSDGVIETTIAYTRDGAPTGTFTVVMDDETLAMHRFEYDPHKRLARPQAIWVDGHQLLGKSGLLQRLQHLKSLDHGVFAPENKEFVLAFVDAEPGEELQLPLAGFGTPPTGWWSVRYDGPGTRVIAGHTVETRTWTALGNGATIVTADRAPYVLGFEFVDPAGVRWIHRTLCEGTATGDDPLAACLL